MNPKTGEECERHASDDEPFSALAFKIMTDPFVGKLAFIRVYSGHIKSGSYVLNSTKGKRERMGRIVQMHANERKEIDEVYAGDIAASWALRTRPPATRCATTRRRSSWRTWSSRIPSSRSPSSPRPRPARTK